MNTRTIAIISIVAVVIASATLVLILTPPQTFDNPPMQTEQGQITRVTFTVGGSNGTISAIFNDIGTTNITISTVYVNNVQQPTWTCYVDGVATSPAVVPYNSSAQFNITTTVVAGSQYSIKLVDVEGYAREYTGTAPS